VTGQSIRTDRYRYTSWIRRSSGATVDVQLYDHQTNTPEKTNLAQEQQQAEQIKKKHRQLTDGWQTAVGPAGQFANRRDVKAPAPKSDVLQTGFDTMTPGPLTRQSDASGSWAARGSHATIHTQHSRSAPQSLRLLGGGPHEVIWSPPERDVPIDRLDFWFERWTRRQPFDFRVEALLKGEWKTLHHDTKSAVVGSFRNHLSLPLDSGQPRKFRFSSTTPPDSGVMIDDVRLVTATPMR
ncbi:MAG: hypothetical protein GY758_15815, partial [Fuerstiella sp.]|nr:hypothetical protein [Fuerstiella sp.]